MKTLKILATALLASILATGTAQAGLLKFTQMFGSGFDVSINGGSPVASGPITITATVDETAVDINASIGLGEFVPLNVTFTGAGFVNETVTTALGLLVWSSNKFAIQLQGQFNVGITGWNGDTSSGSFITDVNDLTTIITTPYSTTGTSTFWWDSIGNDWSLASGDTITANPTIGGGGPDGTFSIESSVPEPTTLVLLGLGFAGLGFSRRKQH